MEAPRYMDSSPKCEEHDFHYPEYPDTFVAGDIEFLQFLESGEPGDLSEAPVTPGAIVGTSQPDGRFNHRARHRQRQARYRSRQKVHQPDKPADCGKTSSTASTSSTSSTASRRLVVSAPGHAMADYSALHFPAACGARMTPQ
jgi:hypothetical protein